MQQHALMEASSPDENSLQSLTSFEACNHGHNCIRSPCSPIDENNCRHCLHVIEEKQISWPRCLLLYALHLLVCLSVCLSACCFSSETPRNIIGKSVIFNARMNDLLCQYSNCFISFEASYRHLMNAWFLHLITLHFTAMTFEKKRHFFVKILFKRGMEGGSFIMNAIIFHFSFPPQTVRLISPVKKMQKYDAL